MSRIGIVASSLLGFIIGRIIVGYKNPLNDKAPDDDDDDDDDDKNDEI